MRDRTHSTRGPRHRPTEPLPGGAIIRRVVGATNDQHSPWATRSTYRLQYDGFVLAVNGLIIYPRTHDEEKPAPCVRVVVASPAGMVALRQSRRMAYAATPCNMPGARLAVRDRGARDMQARTMRTRSHLKPGQKGTKQLLAQYGDRLVCVRYRYDAQRKTRFKTVELIVAQRAWDPPAPRFADDALVAVRVGFAEVELRQRVKQAGGNWNSSRKAWELRYTHVVALKLQARIVDEAASDTGCRG